MTLFEIVRTLREVSGCKDVHSHIINSELKLTFFGHEGRIISKIFTDEELSNTGVTYWRTNGLMIKRELRIQ